MKYRELDVEFDNDTDDVDAHEALAFIIDDIERRVDDILNDLGKVDSIQELHRITEATILLEDLAKDLY